MTIFFLDTDEWLLLTVLKDEQLPEHHPTVQLRTGDTLVFTVDGLVAGAAKISSAELELSFTHIFLPEQRVSLLNAYHTLLRNAWGADLVVNLRTFKGLTGRAEQQFLAVMDKQPSALAFYLTDLDEQIVAAKRVGERRAGTVSSAEGSFCLNSSTTSPEHGFLGSEHSKAQFHLKELALITGCQAWTAANDKTRLYGERPLGSDDLACFPHFTADPEIQRRLELIDTIWFRDHLPISCFEVETSTSIYSGILRMADLAVTMPNRHLKLYIVAPLARKEKVIREMNRPLFQAIGLTHLCQYVSTESLEALYEKLKGLNGYVLPDVIQSIAVSTTESLLQATLPTTES